MKETFNPQDWLNKTVNSDQYTVGSGDSLVPSSPSATADKRPIVPSDIYSEVDTVVTRIEAAFTDIATSYADWLNLGFAFAHEFGEAGRTFYHRVSRFYPGYTLTATDKQYDQCLKSQGHGITIRSFFHMAKEAGIDCTRGRGYEGEMGRSKSNPSVHSANVDKQSFPPMRINSPSTDPSINPSEGNGESLVPSYSHPLVPSEEDDPLPEEEQPTLPDYLFDQLPDFFKRVVARTDSREERDMLLLGSIVSVGSCLTTFSGIYDGNQVFPTLYLYIAAKASSGKGRLVLCRNLVNPVHWEKRKQSAKENQEFEVEMREYNAIKGKDMGIEKPLKPPVRMHIIPANNTTAGLLQLLADNDGQGIIIETEGDTIAKTLKKEISDFSDFLRKGFHHEMISGYRKTDHEHSEVEQPRFNMILSSTMGQLKELIPSTENGLSSRFMFYYMNLRPVWKDVFAHSKNKSLNQHFNELGHEFYSLYGSLREKDPISFSLTDEQQLSFNTFFAQMQDKYLVLQGLDYMAIVRRLGLIAFRIMMILTAMRIPETGDYSTSQQCLEKDFETALAIIRIVVKHASYIVSQMPEEVKTERRGNKKEKFFEGLPEKFTFKEFVELAKSISIPERTAKRYVTVFCEKGLLERENQGSYIKRILEGGHDIK